MLINGKDLDNFNCSMIDRKITPTEVITYNEWLDGAIQPTFIRQQDGFKLIEVTLLMRAESELDAQYLISDLTKESKKCEINFDEDMDELFYDCVLAATPQVERLKNATFKIIMTFQSGYACGKRVTISKPDISKKELDIKVKGTAAAPCIFRVTPKASAIISVVISGITGIPFKVESIPFGKTLEIDSESSTVSLVDQAGNKTAAINHYNDCWELPKLQPGLNTITFDYVTGYDIEISYRPRYY